MGEAGPEPRGVVVAEAVVVVVVEVHGGVDAAVAGAPLVIERVGIGVHRLARATAVADDLTPLPAGRAVEPALVTVAAVAAVATVAAGRVAGKRVAAGVTGVLRLPLPMGEGGPQESKTQSGID